MVEYVKGDLLQADVDALVNPVNCVGVMGKGLALQFRQAYPEMFERYRIDCKDGLFWIGRTRIFGTDKLIPLYIINFPTKLHWKDKSHVKDIRLGLDDLVRMARRLKIRSIAIPPLGCGFGGLDWDEVRPMIEHAATLMTGVRVLVYLPRG